MDERDEKAADWEQRVRQWRESGLSQKEFCTRAGLSLSTLRWWLYDRQAQRRRRRSKASSYQVAFGQGRGAAVCRSGPAPFVAVQVIDDRTVVDDSAVPARADSAAPSGLGVARHAGVTITLAGDRRVTVEPGFDAATLRVVLDVLEGR